MISTQAEMYDCVYFVRRQGMGGFHRQVTLAGDLRAGCLNVANGAWTQGGKILGTDKMGSGHKEEYIGNRQNWVWTQGGEN